MKQSFFSKRAVALLLVLVIALTNLPDIVFAWGGDIFSAQQEQTVSDDGQNQQIPQEVAGVTLSFAPEAEKSTVQMGETGTFYMNVNVPETIDTQIAVRLPQHALQAINQAQPEGVQWMDTMGISVPVELYEDGSSTILQFSLSAGQALVNQPLNLLYQNGYNEEISIPVTEQDITVNETWLQTEQPVEPVAPETPEETLPPTDGDVEVPGEGEVPEGGETGEGEAPGEGEVPGDGETGEGEVPGDGETGEGEVPGDGETGDGETGGNETGDGETGGNETGGSEVPGDGETGDIEVPGDGETGDIEVPEGGETGGETDGSEVGGNETGGNETDGSEAGSETGESEAGKEELSNAQQQEQFQTEGEALQQESQSEGTVELQGVQIVKEFVARPSTELEPQGNNGEPADQPQDGEPAGQQQDDDPAGQQQDGDPAGQQQDDDPAGQQQDDDPAGQQQDDDPADQQQDDDPAGQQQDGEPTEQPENTTPPQVIHQISGGTLTFAVQPFSWGELSLVEGPAEPDDGQPKRSDLFETQPRTVSKVFAMSSVLYQMGMVQQADRTLYKNNGQSDSLPKEKNPSEEPPKERIIDKDFSYHVTIQSENDAQTGTIYTREWTLEQSFTLPQGLQYPTGNAQVVGNQVLIGEVPVVTIDNLDVTGNVSATAENISAVVNGSALTITYTKTITDAENQGRELAAPDLQFVLHGSALKVLDEFAEGEIGVATSFKAISQTGEELTRSASAATPLSLGAAPDEGDPVPTADSAVSVTYKLSGQPTFSDKGKLQVTYQITVENTAEDGSDANVIITMQAPAKTNTEVAPTVKDESGKTWDTDAKTLTWGTTDNPVKIEKDKPWTRTVTVTLTDDTQNNPPKTLTSSVTVTSAGEPAEELAKKESTYPLKDFLEEKKKDVAIAERVDQTQDIYWIDKDDTFKRPSTANYKEGMKLAFCILDKGQNKEDVTDKDYIELTAENMGQVGLDNIDNLITITESGNHWKATANLPTSIHYGGNENNSRQVVWKYVPEEDIPNYTWWNGQAESKKGKWYYLLEEPFSFTVDLRNGAKGDPDTGTIKDLIVKNFTLYYAAKNVQDGTGTINLAKLLQNDSSIDCNVDKDDNGNYIVKITGLGTYTVNGDRVQYAVQYNDEKVDVSKINLPATGIGDEGDWLTVEYKTQGVNNDKVFHGDTMVLTLQGNTTYKANKVWLDMDDKGKRPTGRFELWRYRPGKETWDQASPVRGADGQILTVKLDTDKDTQVIDFSTQLDKYGPEGYEYIYVCKEIIEKEGSSDYEQVFGTVGDDGKVTPDPLPSGETRENGNIYIYENGTLTNRITASRTISATKRWEASSFQSELSDFVVELQLYSRLKGSTDEIPWDIVEGKVLKMEGFTAENLQQSASMSVPTYNEHGKELEYKFMEAKVYLSTDPDKKNLMTKDKDGKPIIEWEKENGQTVLFESIQPTEEEIQKGNAAIVNKVKDTINYDFTKIWQNGWTEDQLQNVIQNGGVTFKLYSRGRDGQNKELFEVTLDGTKDDPETTERVTIGQETYNVTVQELGALSKDQIGEDAAHWPVHIEGLPRYDEGGYQLEYFIFEQEKNGNKYVAGYDITRDPVTGDYEGSVSNPPPIGTGYRILIRKRWIDDSDLYHREDVTITAYYYVDGKNDVELGTLTLEANGVGMDYLYFSDEDLQNGGITNYNVNNVYVLETQMGDTQITGGAVKQDGANYVGETNKVLAKHHDYEITYSILKNGDQGNIANEDVYVVTNRRLGSIDITATKIWQDGGELQKALEKANITPVLVLEFAEQDQSYVDSGEYDIDYEENTVTLGGEEKVQIQNNAGKESKAILPLILGTENNTQDYYFCNLPKYNTLGEVAHYTIKEMWYKGTGNLPENISYNDCIKKKDELIKKLEEESADAELIELLKECSSSVEAGKYQSNHNDDDGDDTDSQEMKVTNKLSGTKDVSFHKTWKDHYVYRILDMRPDIYLTLYRLDNDTDKLEVVEPYHDRVWTEFQGSEWTEYKWSCLFKELPKYDDKGREIFYYATERMAADGANFDYVPVELSYVTETGTIEGDDTTQIEDKDWKRTVVVDGENEEAVLEGGTFTNRIEAPAEISGVKLWDNLPSLWKPENLPTVTFTITCDGVLGNDGQLDGTSPGGEIASITINTGDWTSALKTNFTFDKTGEWKLNKDGSKTAIGAPPAEQREEIPKYDDNGQQYSYTLTEEIEFKDETVSKDQIFSKIESSGYQIKNEYNPTLGALKVKKLLQVGKNWKAYPAVTIELVREYTTDGKNYYEDAGFEPVELTWSAAEVETDAEAAEAAADPDATTFVLDSEDTFTFENLPIYQPNGYEYRYFVREKVVGYLNYQSAVKGGDVKVEDFGTIFEAPSQGVMEDGYLKYDNELYPTKNVNDATAANLDVSATFGDKYEPENIKLTGTKVWEDQNDALELRPKLEDFQKTLTLWRWAPAQSGGENNGIGTEKDPIAVPEHNLDGSKWEWKWEPSDGTDATAKEWTYTITGLEKFAPNGMEWKYVVKEDTDGLDGYYYYPKSASANGSWSENGNTYKMDDLTNSLKINLNFSKEWQDQNGTKLTDDYLGLDKITITGELYVAEGDEKLQPASQYFKNDDGSFKEPWTKWFGTNYDFTPTLETTIGGTKAVTFADLPRVNQAGTTLYYAVAETKITAGGLTQEYDVTVNGQTLKHEIKGTDVLGGLFTPQNVTAVSAESGTTLKIALHNRLQTQELNVEKRWTDETGKKLTDGLPKEVHLVIQREVNETSSDGSRTVYEWKIVTDGSNPLVVKLSSTNLWKAELTGLPTNGIENDKVVTYTYRARELKEGWTGPTVNDDDILDAGGKFGNDYTVSYQDNSGTTVTNKRTHMTLTAEKQWKPSAPSKDKTVTLTLYQRPKDGEWTEFKYDGDTSAKVTLNGEAGTENDTCYASAAWTATWKNLPRADGTTLYEYRVEETVEKSMKDNLFGIVSPETIDSASTDKKFTVKNLPMGKVNIEKMDGNGKALEGVVFELQYKDTAGNWKDIDDTVCKAATFQVQQTTDADGKLTYTHLLLTDENGTQINYQIVEVSTPDGYNRLTEPIAVSFEALTTEKPADLYWKVTGGYLASEVTYTVHNNQYFQTINTGAGGFFWPGVAGAGAACAGVWYLAGRKRRKHNKRHSDR
ncbi:Cna B-type domain-containing protein [uncultured Negativibacillus sp.]|uniref:SpaA isopeptide-forming pilin-related protein n=1 Tax=uncultured Negativibacillus sp. TaxID=1980696 RepID=UPI0025D6B5FC|nr:Cna B-type domain-containing protein [uncultured Negativibacillus sp.]